MNAARQQTSAHFPKFVLRLSTTFHELRKVMGTSKLNDSSAASLFEVPELSSPRVTQELQIGGTAESGFTLIETLVALALMGLVLSALANLTAQWLPNWNRGLERIQRSEMISMALQQIGADLAAAEFVPANRGEKRPLFEGSELSVMFVRTALGPNAGLGLDVIRLSESSDPGGVVTVRSRMPFRPLPLGATLPDQLHFGEPVLLFRAPYRLSFAYAGEDRVWKSSWRESDKLPAAIKLTVRDMASERVLAISTVTPVHIQASGQGGCSQDDRNCDAAPNAAGGGPQANLTANPQGAAGSAPPSAGMQGLGR
jgi:general secretion pathway protein J